MNHPRLDTSLSTSQPNAQPDLALASPFPKPGDTVKVTLRNGEEVQGVIEWVDNNGAWIKGEKRSRWVPIEIIINPQPPVKPKETREGSPSLTEQSRIERQPTREEE